MITLKTFLLETLSCLSRLLNVFTGGTADLTFSARSYIDGLWTEKWIDRLAYLFLRERNHCRMWWEIEVERSKRIVHRGNSAGSVEIYEKSLAP